MSALQFFEWSGVDSVTEELAALVTEAACQARAERVLEFGSFEARDFSPAQSFGLPNHLKALKPLKHHSKRPKHHKTLPERSPTGIKTALIA